MTKPDAIRPLSLKDVSINWMLYGDPGMGKTPLISTADKALILDADTGKESALLMGSTAEVWTMQTWSDMDEANEYCRHEKGFPFKWVFLDGITQWQDLGLKDILEEEVARNPRKRTWPEVPDKPEYLRNQNRLLKWVTEMKAAPFNFGMTAYPMTIEDNDGKPLTMPMIVGKPNYGMTKMICGHMNLITHLTIRKGKDDEEPYQVLQTQRMDTRIYARDRFRALPALYKNPTVPKMEARIFSRMEELAPKPVRKKKTTTRRRRSSRRS